MTSASGRKYTREDRPGGRRLRTNPSLGFTEEEREFRKRHNEESRRARRAKRAPVLNAASVAARVLPLPVAALLGQCLGLGAYLFSRSSRKRILGNIELAFGDELPPAERRRIARRSLQLMGRGLLSLVALHRMGKERTLARIDVQGADRLEEVIRERGSCVIFGAHFGLMELAGICIADAYQSRSVGADASPGSPTETLIAMRKDLGVETIQRGDPRLILRELKAGRPVGMVVDHDVKGVRGVFVPFFGRPAHTVLGPAKIAVRMGVPLVPVVTDWVGLTRHRVRFLEPLDVRDDLPKAERTFELTARFTRLIEDQIRRRPDHWMWLHKRWRTRPEDAPGLPVYPAPGPSGPA